MKCVNPVPRNANHANPFRDAWLRDGNGQKGHWLVWVLSRDKREGQTAPPLALKEPDGATMLIRAKATVGVNDIVKRQV